MKEKTSGKMKTELPVTIYTGYEYETGNETENYRQQIEKAAFYLESIFNLLKRAARNVESEAQDNCELAVFVADVEHLSEIGFGIAASIFKPVSELESLSKNENLRVDAPEN